jgi:ferrous iron transport protein B
MATIAVVGKESVGKTQLLSSLTGQSGESANFRGTTVAVQAFYSGGSTWLDTPGILKQSDSETTRAALQALDGEDRVLLVLKATHLDQDLADLLPLIQGKRAVLAVTYWDKVRDLPGAGKKLAAIANELDATVVPVDARSLAPESAAVLQAAVAGAKPMKVKAVKAKVGWRFEADTRFWRLPVIGPLAALVCLFAPAWFSVKLANAWADGHFDAVKAWFAPWVERAHGWPGPLASIFGGDYGLLSMLPFLFLYALPTVALFSLILSVLKGSGLVDRFTAALHPWLRPFGLEGRDLVRVIMGFGCNVPAVINSRACSSCTRGACVGAIAFGAACSYQLPATLAVFSAVKMEWLGPVYLAILAASTLIYTRFTTPKALRDKANALAVAGQDFLQWPQPGAVVRETWSVIAEFFTKALPIFFGICIAAALLQWSGVLAALQGGLAPVMAAFRLPGDAALAVVLASIRKDGILLLSNPAVSAALSPAQVLTAVYLSGVLLPCLVTALTIGKELGRRFALRLMFRQALWAMGFSLVIAWVGFLSE